MIAPAHHPMRLQTSSSTACLPMKSDGAGRPGDTERRPHRLPTWQAGSSCGVEVTDHAITRYIERVDPRADYVTAIAALSSPAIIAAVQFGAPYVRLPGNQRVALDGATVVTVLPAQCPHWRLGVAK
jgi:hypothetical protein